MQQYVGKDTDTQDRVLLRHKGQRALTPETVGGSYQHVLALHLCSSTHPRETEAQGLDKYLQTTF